MSNFRGGKTLRGVPGTADHADSLKNSQILRANDVTNREVTKTCRVLKSEHVCRRRFYRWNMNSARGQAAEKR